MVFSIEEFSVFDGPGIRTTVFLMGCPLRCEWCHSPEGQVFKNFILRSPNGCKQCGNCIKYAVKDGGRFIFTQKSIDNCPENLLRYCAKEYTPEELYKVLEKNFDILSMSGGGITFSGGEPTASGDFLLNCLSLLENKVHRAVQTCGHCSNNMFIRALANCDYMLFDIKIVDRDLHRKYTGVYNDNIIENFKTLAKSGKDFVIRTPLIPGVTDTEENITNVAKLLISNGVDYIELLPYNKLAGAKYALCQKEFSPSFNTILDSEPRINIFKSFGIKTKIV